MKNDNSLYANTLLAVLVIVSIFAIINRYSLKFTIVMMSSWGLFILYNKLLATLLYEEKISKSIWLILWLIGWIIVNVFCFIMKGVV